MNFRKIIPFSLLAAIILGVIALAFPVGTVAAQSTTPPTPKDPQAQAARGDARLEKAFQKAKIATDKQGLNLDRLGRLTLKVSNLIDKAKANGKNTAALESAMAAFKGKEADARSQHQSAERLVNNHNGFDANGQVVNREQAKETVKSIHEILQSVRKTIAQAAKDFRDAVKTWRTANPPKPST